MPKVMRSKPAKHGKTLDCKKVGIVNKVSDNGYALGQYLSGTYMCRPGKTFFALVTYDEIIMGLVRKEWTVEEIIESEE